MVYNARFTRYGGISNSIKKALKIWLFKGNHENETNKKTEPLGSVFFLLFNLY